MKKNYVLIINMLLLIVFIGFMVNAGFSSTPLSQAKVGKLIDKSEEFYQSESVIIIVSTMTCSDLSGISM